MAEAEAAVQKARAIQQQSAQTIRVGSSFLNPGNVLIDLWNRISPAPTEYRFKIVPYDDNHQKILSVVSSLGKTMDFMVGSFNSAQMLRLSRFCQLGEYRLCIAVPRNHRLAGKERLSLHDLHGERLVAVKSGDTLQLDRLREAPLPAVVPIPGISGNTGLGLRQVKRSVEQAVGSDILANES